MRTLEEKAILALSMLDGVSLKKKYAIFYLFDDLSAIWQNSLKNSQKLLQIIGEKDYNKMMNTLSLDYIDNYIKNLASMGIEFITIESEKYPKLLKEIDAPPLVLYLKGDSNLLNTDCIGIVGTRRATKYGREVTEKFAKELAKAGITVVSGLADGVDTIAHTATLDVNGATIAVLGSGFNHVYPQNNLALSEKIAKKGLIVSEYKPNDKPQTYQFPERNRIIAALSKSVLITEAPIKSGALITKDFALSYNRDVYAVPGRITDSYSAGCNTIIRNLQSSVVIEPEQIINDYGKTSSMNFNNIKKVQLTIDEEIILTILDDGESGFEEILLKSEFETKRLNTVLLSMQMKGLITKLPGNVYRR